MPRRVRAPSRRRDSDDGTVQYIDPPLPERQYRGYESSSEYTSSPSTMSNRYSDEDEPKTQIRAPLPLRDVSGRNLGSPGGNLVEDSRFRQVNREPMTKFESLRIGEGNLRGISIGGFKIDMELAANKAREIIPLPPARLPLIFQDDTLNFYHHFFNGIYEIVRHDDLMEVINTDPVDGQDSDFMIKVIEDLLATGYERSDSEALNLIKRMLQSTFRVDKTKHRNSAINSSLFVEANLWGFPYIESTMTCKELDLRLWLQACYKNYETSWFSLFKSTMVPSFARKVGYRGSQSSQASSRPSMRAIDEESSSEIADMLRDDATVNSSTSHRKTRRRHSSRSSSDGHKAVNQWFGRK